jgi:hypothetical protein
VSAVPLKELKSNEAVELEVMGFVDNAHSTTTNFSRIL